MSLKILVYRFFTDFCALLMWFVALQRWFVVFQMWFWVFGGGLRLCRCGLWPLWLVCGFYGVAYDFNGLFLDFQVWFVAFMGGLAFME